MSKQYNADFYICNSGAEECLCGETTRGKRKTQVSKNQRKQCMRAINQSMHTSQKHLSLEWNCKIFVIGVLILEQVVYYLCIRLTLRFRF